MTHVTCSFSYVLSYFGTYQITIKFEDALKWQLAKVEKHQRDDTQRSSGGCQVEPRTHIEKKRKPMNLFSHGYNGSWSWARTYDDDGNGVAQDGKHTPAYSTLTQNYSILIGREQYN